MPTVLVHGKYAIYVYSADHRPVHCHVKWHIYEIKVILPDYDWVCLSKRQPNRAEIQGALDLVKGSKNEIGKIWRKFHGN